MTEKLEPTRETDICVAEAMGWVDIEDGRHGLMGLAPGEAWGQRNRIQEYSTDEALLVPMIRRIEELTDNGVVLKYFRACWTCEVWLSGRSAFASVVVRSRSVPNAAVADTLLAVWREAKKREENRDREA